MGKIMRGTFSFNLTNTLPAIGFDQGFILKNNICKNIEIQEEKKSNDPYVQAVMQQNDKESPPKQWKWIFTCTDLKAMETNLFVMGQYERFKRQQWKFNPEIFFSSMEQDSNYQPYNHHFRNNSNSQNNNGFFGVW
mmetsp:Transcript_21304/g.18780  ORF Transcript_21304/g.18780 Transcript_21304/m.18780 type:complete len:136 (+) Transcript_21304:3-410(+)